MEAVRAARRGSEPHGHGPRLPPHLGGPCPRLHRPAAGPAARAALCRMQGGSGLGRLALRTLLPAPDHAAGCPRLRPASANQPVIYRACFRRRGCCSAWVCPWSLWQPMHGRASRARSCSGGWTSITPRRAELCTPRGSAGGGGCEIFAWPMRVSQAGSIAWLTMRRYRLGPVAMTAPPPLRRSPALGPAGREALRCPLVGLGPAGAHTAAKEYPSLCLIDGRGLDQISVNTDKEILSHLSKSFGTFDVLPSLSSLLAHAGSPRERR